MTTDYAQIHRYAGVQWVKANLPMDYQPWLQGEYKSLANETGQHLVKRELLTAIKRALWQWPKRPIIFISDLHADTDAFFDSLVASGGVEKTGQGDDDFCLTTFGQQALFLIGGDCLDKGPSNLRLLRAIQKLRCQGARVRHLAGNHDIRIMLGIHFVGVSKTPKTDHLFIRMGAKIVPFLKEIVDEYRLDEARLTDIPSTEKCRQQLYPQDDWYDEFPKHAQYLMSNKAIKKELRSIGEKQKKFEQACQSVGLSIRMAYIAALKWQALFLDPNGEFYWFFNEMKLVYKTGSFLFLHAGIDDHTVSTIVEKGVKKLNSESNKLLYKNPFEFYYGPTANIMRTKYRSTDYSLSQYGTSCLHAAGIYIIVHGHNNRYHGQRIMMRKGMVNFECDASLDQTTRKKEGLKGYGAAATVFFPDAVVMGISSDYETIKVFEPSILLGGC